MTSREIDEILERYRLKDQVRTGWELRNVSEPESVADHSWGTAYLCIRFADTAGVNLERALSLAVVHDLAEAVAGDVARRANPADQSVPDEEKRRRERDVMDRWSEREPRLVELWNEYESGETAAALFVREMNLLDMCLQALYYERLGRNPPDRDLQEFFETSEPRLTSEYGRRVHAAIRAEYELTRDERVRRKT